jgi:hypothetical protein
MISYYKNISDASDDFILQGHILSVLLVSQFWSLAKVLWSSRRHSIVVCFAFVCNWVTTLLESIKVREKIFIWSLCVVLFILVWQNSLSVHVWWSLWRQSKTNLQNHYSWFICAFLQFNLLRYANVHQKVQNYLELKVFCCIFSYQIFVLRHDHHTSHYLLDHDFFPVCHSKLTNSYYLFKL